MWQQFTQFVADLLHRPTVRERIRRDNLRTLTARENINAYHHAGEGGNAGSRAAVLEQENATL